MHTHVSGCPRSVKVTTCWGHVISDTTYAVVRWRRQWKQQRTDSISSFWFAWVVFLSKSRRWCGFSRKGRCWVGDGSNCTVLAPIWDRAIWDLRSCPQGKYCPIVNKCVFFESWPSWNTFPPCPCMSFLHSAGPHILFLVEFACTHSFPSLNHICLRSSSFSLEKYHDFWTSSSSNSFCSTHLGVLWRLFLPCSLVISSYRCRYPCGSFCERYFLRDVHEQLLWNNSLRP